MLARAIHRKTKSMSYVQHVLDIVFQQWRLQLFQFSTCPVFDCQLHQSANAAWKALRKLVVEATVAR